MSIIVVIEDSTFRKLSSLNKKEIDKILINYPKTVRKEVLQLLE
jgi:hypothetical protein